MDKGIIDGVTTSSAVVAHENGGALDGLKIKVPGSPLEGMLDHGKLPRVIFLTHRWMGSIKKLEKEIYIDGSLLQHVRRLRW